ncbi:hypothetical protein HDZ31DRAFT_68956 [Schizophyllum fasciatum]
MSTERRDPSRRRQSKRAYYERHKERLREQARQRAAAQRDDPSAKEARHHVLKKYRAKHAEELRLQRLNYRRRLFIEKHGVAAFREKYVTRLTASERERIPWGYLLEDHDDNTLAPIHTYRSSTP